MLQTPSLFADLSPEEQDALAIVHAKLGCARVISKTSTSFEHVTQKVKQNTFTNVGTLSEHNAARTPELASASSPASGSFQELSDMAHDGLHKVKQAAKKRVQTAANGKQFLDEGGEIATQLLMSKRVCIDAVRFDKDLTNQVEQAVLVFEDSATQLTEAHRYTSIIGHGDLVPIIEEHAMRANTYREISNLLQSQHVSCVDMDDAEWDALTLIKMKAGYNVFQSKTTEAFQAVRSIAFTNCIEDGSDARRGKTVCG